MKRLIGWFRPPDLCNRAQDEILSRTAQPGSVTPESAWPADIARHIEECAGCRELSDAIRLTHRVHPAWRSDDPPSGLAIKTIEFLEPHWKRAEKPLTREEVRLLWTGGLGMAGAAAAFLLVLFDVPHPAVGGFAAEGLIKIGARLTLLQILGGTVLSVVLLAIRAARSTEAEPRPRQDQNRGGSE
jgi:hypothetical protein